MATEDRRLPAFLARRDLPFVELPFHRVLLKTAALREKTASSRLSLEREIDKFQLKEEKEVQEEPVEILDSKGELNRASVAHSP